MLIILLSVFLHGLSSVPLVAAYSRWYAAHASRAGTTILFESPFRIVESLREMAATWGDPPVAVGRELTKLHEEILRGPSSEVAARLSSRPRPKGEFAIAVAPRAPQAAERSAI